MSDGTAQKKKLLLTLSATLVLAATIGFGLIPVLDSKITTHSIAAENAQDKYFELRRSLDMGSFQWELARMFLVNQDILSKLGADKASLERNQKHYHYNILNALTFAENAAKGYDDSGKYKGTVTFGWSPGRSDEEVQKNYHDLLIAATFRNTALLAERDRYQSASNGLSRIKSIIHTTCLAANCVGLLIGIFAIKYK